MTTLFNNLQSNSSSEGWSFAELYPRHAQQFRLLLPATITELTFMLARRNTGLTGTVVVKIYGSDGDFRDPTSIPSGEALATSTNTVDASGLEDIYDGGNYLQLAFAFNSVELPAGTYWASVECNDIYTNGESSQMVMADDNLGYYVFSGNNLGSFSEYWYDGQVWSWQSASDMD